MPTSKARKRRIVARQREAQKISLERKSKLGLKKKDRLRSSSNSNALTAMVDFVRYTVAAEKFKNNFESTDDSSSNLELDEVVKCQLGGSSRGKADFQNLKVGMDVTTNEYYPKDEDTKKNYSADVAAPRNEQCSTVIKNVPSDVQEPACQKTAFQLFYSMLSVGSWPFRVLKSFRQAFYAISAGPLSKELADLKSKVLLLEKELQDVRKILAEKEINGWPANHDLAVPLIPVPSVPATILAASAPPPPPPPPPPPLPAPILQKQAIKIKKRRKTGSPSGHAAKASSGLHITNDQLQKVKLRKVSFKAHTTKTTPAKRMQLVTLEDLQNIRLRKTPSGNVDKENIPIVDCNTPLRDLTNFKSDEAVQGSDLSSIRRTPHTGYNLRRTLRKVNLVRSPGGTPLIKAKMETGVGFTPLLAAALKRKFQNVRQSSLENSPDF